MLTVDDWFAGGERVPVALPGAGMARDAHIFCRVEGSGPWLTFLHGFPTCSWDWAPLVDNLKARHRLLLLDFLGYGDSDKPHGHDYSIFEQADIVQALWRHLGVAETGLVAHDYGDTVALELLARQAEGASEGGVAEAPSRARVSAAFLLNGGVYVALYHPLRVQTLLQRPLLGAMLSRLISERSFDRSFTSLFAPAHPIAAADVRQHWAAIRRRDGQRNYHRLIRYIGERRRHHARWEGALERPGVPARYVWGMRDPVSGGQMMERLRERVPTAAIVELADVGHYPQLEVPERIAREITATFSYETS